MRVGLVFGYGQKADGSLLNQTRDRCKKGAELYHTGKIEKIFLTGLLDTAGVDMSYAMREDLIKRGVSSQDISVEGRGKNTAGEMDIFLWCLRKDTHAVFISTWYHVPRIIWLALWRISPTRFSVGIAWKYAQFKGDFLMEFLKIINAVFWPYSSAKFAKL